MGSKWRWNVFEQGLVGTGATLASRVLGFDDRYYVTNIRDVVGNQLRYVTYYRPIGEDQAYIRGVILSDGSNFPGGIPVEPDEPR